ncbi:MAG: hypothetical protein HY721_17315 [Planctomycetes bacterium]|nr:hypothetical protein [Planctomycetota bacterium]
MVDSFLLSKWYLDCVSQEGRVFIGYAATLRWRLLRLRSMSAMECGLEGRVVEMSTLRGYSEPQVRGDALRWTAPRLRVAGRWAALPASSATLPPRAVRLLDSESGRVDWTCHLPRAQAKVEVGGRALLEGLGYAERLELTVRPWMLPIDELRWGRFLAEDISVVWIEWRGPKPLSLVIHDGTAVGGAVVSDAALRFGDFELKLDSPRVLREGTLGSTALRGLRLLRPLLPRRLLDTHECKWLSRGSLVHAGKLVSSGWAIHEVVKWS